MIDLKKGKGKPLFIKRGDDSRPEYFDAGGNLREDGT